MLRAFVCAIALAAPVALPAQDFPDGMAVEAIGSDKGEIMMPPGDQDAGIDSRMIFEPLQSFDEMFLRDDVVYLMRHGPTDWSHLDEKDVAPTDCARQRVMSEEGRQDMQDMGALLAKNDILPSRIVHSEWCRNRQTVENLLAGISRFDPDAAQAIPVETDPQSNLLLSLQGAPDVSDLRERIAAWDGDPDRDGPLLIVSHFTNIQELTQFSVFEGEILVIDPDRGNRVLGYIRLASAAPDAGHFEEAAASPLRDDERALDMVTRYYDALNRHDDDTLANLLSDRWVMRGLDETGSGTSAAGFLDRRGVYQDALDDPVFEIETIHVSDGIATVIGSITGRHSDVLFGITRTGRDVAFRAIEVHRIESGEIVESWAMVDRLSLLHQIRASN